MEIKRMFLGNENENYFVVELPDGSFSRFFSTPFRKVEEKDLRPLKAYRAIGNRAKEVPDYLTRCYGFVKVADEA